jgi:hypothetical protein
MSLPHIPRHHGETRRLRAYLWQPSKAPGLALMLGSLPFLALWALAQLVVLIGIGLAENFVANSNWATEWADIASRILSLLFWALTVLLAVVATPWGLALLVGAIWLFGPMLYRRLGAASDEEFDARLTQDIAWLHERGYAKLQLQRQSDNDEGDLVVVGEPLILKAGLSESVGDFADLEEGRARWAFGRDQDARFRLYRVTVLYPAQHHIGHYVCEFNVETGLILSEITSESHLKDVTACITTESAERLLELPPWWDTLVELCSIFKVSAFMVVLTRLILKRLTAPQDFVARTFTLLLASGHALAVPYYRGTPPTLDARNALSEDALLCMRNLLREKRMSYVRLLAA